MHATTSSTFSSIPSLHAFDPRVSTWQSYRDRVDFYFLANGIEADEVKKSLFLWAVGESTYNLLESLVAPIRLKEETLTFAALVKKLDAHYDISKNILTSTYDFYSCYQKQGQSFAEWKAELCEKLRYCGFSTSVLKDKQQDRALRDMYVIGVSNPKIRQALLKEGDPSLEEAERIIQVAERLQNDVRHFNSSNNQSDQTVAKVHQKPSNRQRSSMNSRQSTTLEATSCQTCGSMKHSRNECKYRELVCNFCKRKGHLERVCRQKAESTKTRRSNQATHQLKRVKRTKSTAKSVPLEVQVNEVAIIFDVDTGSEHTIVSSLDWKKLGSPLIRPSALSLECYSGNQLEIMGECDVMVNYGNQQATLGMVIVKGATPPLLGLQWITALRLDLNSLVHGPGANQVRLNKVYSQSKLQETLEKNKEVFSSELGHCTKIQARIQLMPNAIPKFFKPRSVPFALVDAVKEEIQRNVSRGILEKVEASQWAAPIVPIRKPSGKIRICGDFKVTLNPQIVVDQHPIPSIDELLVRLNNGEKFTKLDLSDAYLQVELDEASKQLVVINTSLGLFRYNRMPFGIANAPAIFQRTIDQVLAGIPNCVAYLDDILITGKDETDHLATLDLVLSKLADFGLRCNKDKCEFFKDEVLYLGYIVNRNGKQPDPQRVDAIRKLPAPTDLKQIEAFIGKVNYYNKFIPNFSTLCGPLNRLRQKDVQWKWTSSCQQAFENLKKQLAEATMLVHFDPKLQIVLATDASSYGIGAVIMHRYPDGMEKPIAHASKTLTAAEKGYSQIEKEALSIVYGVKKFHQYLAGAVFELVTDHQPLLTIFSPRKGIPITTANRLQRWAITLMGYRYNISYKPTKQHGNADALSRLPSGEDNTFVDEESIQVNRIQTQVVEEGPVDCATVRSAVDADENLRLVRKFVSGRWPRTVSKAKDPDLFPFYQIRQSLSVVDGCVLKGTQVVIPKQLRPQVLRMIHRTHLGVVKMKQLVRIHCWWPKIELDVERLAKSCHICSTVAMKPKEDFKPWPEPEHVWSRVHMDFLGPLWNSKWLIMIDAKSKFPFVADMGHDTTAGKLCSVLEEAIDLVGPPTTLVSDNGPPFTSFEMKQFYKKYGIEHLTIAPYHPASNGIAERFVRSFKEGMTKEQLSGQTNKSIALRNVLRNYRWAPHTTTGVPPAELMFKRPIRTELARLQPTSKETTKYEGKFQQGQLVWVAVHRPHKQTKWEPGLVKRNVGSMMYEVNLQDGQNKMKHQNQLRLRQSSLSQSFDMESLPDDLSAKTKSTEENDDSQHSMNAASSSSPPPQTPRYPRRNRRPPKRYSP